MSRNKGHYEYNVPFKGAGYEEKVWVEHTDGYGNKIPNGRYEYDGTGRGNMEWVQNPSPRKKSNRSNRGGYSESTYDRRQNDRKAAFEALPIEIKDVVNNFIMEFNKNLRTAMAKDIAIAEDLQQNGYSRDKIDRFYTKINPKYKDYLANALEQLDKFAKENQEFEKNPGSLAFCKKDLIATYNFRKNFLDITLNETINTAYGDGLNPEQRAIHKAELQQKEIARQNAAAQAKHEKLKKQTKLKPYLKAQWENSKKDVKKSVSPSKTLGEGTRAVGYLTFSTAGHTLCALGQLPLIALGDSGVRKEATKNAKIEAGKALKSPLRATIFPVTATYMAGKETYKAGKATVSDYKENKKQAKLQKQLQKLDIDVDSVEWIRRKGPTQQDETSTQNNSINKWNQIIEKSGNSVDLAKSYSSDSLSSSGEIHIAKPENKKAVKEPKGENGKKWLETIEISSKQGLAANSTLTRAIKAKKARDAEKNQERTI
jgi:hypothetical protein